MNEWDILTLPHEDECISLIARPAEYLLTRS